MNRYLLWLLLTPLLLLSVLLKCWGSDRPWAVGEVPKTVCKSRCLVQDMGACYKKEDYDCATQWDYFLQLNGEHYMQAKSTEALTDFAYALNDAHERRMPHPHGTGTLTYTTAPWVDPCPGCGDPGIMPALPPGTYNPCLDGSCK